jgi:hypothetical protein
VGVNEMSEPLFIRLGGFGFVRQEKKSGWISFLIFFVYAESIAVIAHYHSPKQLLLRHKTRL